MIQQLHGRPLKNLLYCYEMSAMEKKNGSIRATIVNTVSLHAVNPT